MVYKATGKPTKARIKGEDDPSRPLTPKESAFALAMVENGMDPRKALVTSTPNAAKWSFGAQSSGSWQMMQRANVRKAIGEMTARLKKKAENTLESYLEELSRDHDIAIQEGEISAAIRATELRGKALGYFIERTLLPPAPSSRTANNLRDLSYAELIDLLPAGHPARSRLGLGERGTEKRCDIVVAEFCELLERVPASATSDPNDQSFGESDQEGD